MKILEIDYKTLVDWESRLDTAYRILEGQRRSGIWTLVCDEALRDLNAVRSEIDREIVDCVEEPFRD
jgi:TolB-like protein